MRSTLSDRLFGQCYRHFFFFSNVSTSVYIAFGLVSVQNVLLYVLNVEEGVIL